jgi:F0F1-type ATP synthase alpha subunit
VEPATRKTLERGALLRELLRQPRLSPRSAGREVFELAAVDQGWLDGLPPREAVGVMARAVERGAQVVCDLDPAKRPDDEWLARAAAVVRRIRTEGPR